MTLIKIGLFFAAKVLPWQRHSGRHYVSFMMCISGVKFEEHRPNIFRDILDTVFNFFFGTIYVVIIKIGTILQF